MKASGSILCSALAAAYVAAHLPFLAPSLEDIDSINFALALREFDVAQHQPHPPGYPVYVALGRVSLFVLTGLAPTLAPVRAEALALAIWSAAAGAIAIAAGYALFRRVAAAGGGSDTPAVAAVLLLTFAPLFWISGLRPMSDLPGLAVALVAQALTVGGWHSRSLLVRGAFIAGVAVGIRVQAFWLTAPLLALVMVRHRAAGWWWLASRPVAAAAAGSLIWAVPLVAMSGGSGGYLRALGTQAGEDFAWVDMLWANPTPRRLAFALYETFVLPWGSVPTAAVVLSAAAIGGVVALFRAPLAVGLVAVAFVPYALFHLLFQETLNVRYALPVVVPIAWCAGQAVAATRRAAPVAAILLAALAAWTSIPAAVAYASDSHPAFRAIEEMGAAAPREQPAGVFAHYAIRRPLQAAAPATLRVVEPPRVNEWAGVVRYWRDGGTAPVWFLADPKRTDLAVIDPQALRTVRRYRWAVADRMELAGTRPVAVDWYRLVDPGWFAGEGWSLTPELGGVTRLTGSGVDRRPVDAFVRRRSDPMVALIGTRHLGTAADAAVRFALSIDGRLVDQWTTNPRRSLNDLRVLQLPAGALEGPGRYARLTIAAGAPPVAPVAIRQFDIQPASGLIHGFDEGWHEEEYDNASGARWRWSSARSVLRIVPPQAVRIRLRGESPLTYLDAPPRVRIVAGDHIVAEMRPDRDFAWNVTVPREAAIAADGRIAIETDPIYLPGRVEGTADERQLGLRLLEIAVTPVSP